MMSCGKLSIRRSVVKVPMSIGPGGTLFAILTWPRQALGPEALYAFIAARLEMRTMSRALSGRVRLSDMLKDG